MPGELPRTALLGGYDVARAIHLLVLVALALFTVVHVIQVLLHPRTLADMTVGRGERPAAEAPPGEDGRSAEVS
jgi:thiosulfate reductase cytochrome b subunit